MRRPRIANLTSLQGRLAKRIVIVAVALCSTVIVAVVIMLFVNSRVEHSYLKQIELGMSKSRLEALVGCPTGADIQKNESFPYPRIMWQKILVGNTDNYESVDSYDWGLGWYWVYYDANERVVAVVEVGSN